MLEEHKHHLPMRYLLVLLLPLSLGLASCGNNENNTAYDETTETIGDPGSDVMTNDQAVRIDEAGNNELNATLDAVRGVGGDLTALPATTAVATIDGWLARMQGVDGTYEIQEGLRELREELTSSEIDGREVGTILKSLAEDTRELDANNSSLSMLSQSLEAAGDKLGGL